MNTYSHVYYKLTAEQRRINNRNYKHAKEVLNPPVGYVLHHKDPSWIDENIERYIQWNIEDLEVMSKSDHMKLHNTGENNPMYGKTTSGSGWEAANKKFRDNPEWAREVASKRASARNKTCWKNPEYKEYMVEKMHQSQYKPIRCIELEKEYKCVNDAIRELSHLGLNKYFINKSANNGIPVKGYTFEWVKRSLPS